MSLALLVRHRLPMRLSWALPGSNSPGQRRYSRAIDSSSSRCHMRCPISTIRAINALARDCW